MRPLVPKPGSGQYPSIPSHGAGLTWPLNGLTLKHSCVSHQVEGTDPSHHVHDPMPILLPDKAKWSTQELHGSVHEGGLRLQGCSLWVLCSRRGSCRAVAGHKQVDGMLPSLKKPRFHLSQVSHLLAAHSSDLDAVQESLPAVLGCAWHAQNQNQGYQASRTKCLRLHREKVQHLGASRPWVGELKVELGTGLVSAQACVLVIF